MIAIDPYVGVGPLNFGMTEAEVHAQWGSPRMVTTNWLKEAVLAYDEAQVILSEGKVIEVTLLPVGSVKVGSIDVYVAPTAFADLCLRDGAPKVMAGSVVLLNVGVALSGFHDGHVEQKTISAFARGRWDRFLPKMTSFHAP
jgi:hypothetical protein